VVFGIWRSTVLTTSLLERVDDLDAFDSLARLKIFGKETIKAPDGWRTN
jgi:hypothetical protein